MRFQNRAEAGRRLAALVQNLGLVSPVVLGLPRGGIPVAAEVATALGVPLEVFVAAKVGMPGYEELGIGAVAEGLDEPVISEAARGAGVDSAGLHHLARGAWRELERRVALYRSDRAFPPVAGRHVVVVDDGLATGVTAEAALLALRRLGPDLLVLAVPVCAQETAARLASLADEIVCAEAPRRFLAVGQWYEDFSQTSDEQVLQLLDRGRAQPAGRR